MRFVYRAVTPFRIGFLLILLSYLSPAGAEAPDTKIDFNIPAGPLSVTLIEIARSSGTLVSFPPALVNRHTAPAVQGQLTLVQALTLAIQTTDLSIEFTNGGAVTVREGVHAPVATAAPRTVPAAEPPAPTPAEAALPRVEVFGSGRAADSDGLRSLRGWSATRDSTPLAELPQTVSVLNEEALTLQGGATTLEALHYVTGLTETIDVFGTGGLSVPSHQIRGFAAAYALSGMLTARNGVPADISFVDRIEVPKGPSGVIAGFATDSGDLGGVVNLVRKRAGPGLQTQVSQSISSADKGTLRVTGDVGGASSENGFWRVLGYASRSGPTEGGYTGKSSSGLLGSLTQRHNDVTAALTVQVDARRSVPAAASRGGVALVDGQPAVVPLEDGVQSPLDPQDRVSSRSADIEIEFAWRLSPRWSMQWKGRSEGVDSDMRRHELFSPAENRRDRTLKHAMQAELHADLSAGEIQQKVLLGLDLEQRHELNTGVRNLFDPRPDQFITQDLRQVKQALVLQDQIGVGPWKARLAVQRARIPKIDLQSNANSETGVVIPDPVGKTSGTNWDAGLLYQLAPSTSVYGGVQTTIEAGRYSVDDYVLSDGSARPPARMRQAQAGLRVESPERHLSLRMEVFRTRLLDTTIFTADNLLVLLPGRYSKGLEVELSGRPNPALDLQMGLTLMRANNVFYPGPDHQAFELATAGIPEKSFHVLALYRLPDDTLPNSRLGMGLRAFSSSLVGPPDNFIRRFDYRLPGGALLDVSLQHLMGPWSVQGFINNALDRRLYANTYEVTYLPLHPRRHVGLTLTYKE